MSRPVLRPAPLGLALCIALPCLVPIDRAAGQASTAADAFGTRIGTESIGLYSESLVRGFDLQQAGNYLLDDAYLVRAASPPDTLVQGSRIRVGPNALDIPFPAPSGVVQYRLLPGDRDRLRVEAGFQHLLDDNPRPYLRAHFARQSADGRASLAGGVLGSPSARYIYGNEARYSGLGLVPRLQRGPLSLTAFHGVYRQRYQADVGFVPAGDRLPQLDRRDYLGQTWSRYETRNTTRGLIAETDPEGGPWRYAFSAVQSQVQRPRSDFNLFTDVTPTGEADGRVIIAEHRNVSSTGLEARAARSFDGATASRRLTLIGRDRQSSYARPSVHHVLLGRTQLFAPIDTIAEPERTEGPRRSSHVDQRELGAAWQVAWHQGHAVNFSLRQAQVDESFEFTPGVLNELRSRNWLYSSSAVVALSPRATGFASVVRGLVEAGVAPQNASNAFDILSPSLARQAELGFKWQSRPATLIGTVFESTRPEPGFDADGAFAYVALARHRGLEMSANLSPVSGLNLLLGASWMRARLAGEAVEAGRIGERPVGRSERLLLASLEYRPWGASAWSVDADATYSGPRPADTWAATRTPGYTLLNTGLRYRFTLRSLPALVRLRIHNLGNVHGWHVDSSGMQSHEPGRRVMLSLTLGD